MKFTDARALVTGGTSGIGLSLARGLAARGAQVIVCGRDESRLVEARRQGLATVRADVATDAGRRELLAAVREAGGLDILVNNAGSQTLMNFLEAPSAGAIHDELALNFEAPILLGSLALPLLLERRPGHPRALLVNVTSGLALTPKQSAPVYCATKAGLRSFTQALRYQLADSAVRVVEALPPLVDTEMTRGRGRKKMSADECAEQILAGLARDADEILVGQTWLLMLVLRLAPWLAKRIMRRS